MSLIKNSALYLISTVCLKAVSFFLLPLYSNLVSPEEYGYVYVVSAFSTVLCMFFTFSSSGAISRFYFDCDSLEDIKNMYSQIVFSIVVFSSALFSLLYVFRVPMEKLLGLPEKYYLYALLISYLTSFYELIINLLYSMEKALRISITSISVGVVTIVLQILFVFNMEDKTLALVLAMLANSIIVFVIFIVYSLPYLIIPTFKKHDMIKFAKFSLSQIPSDISSWIVSASDRVMLNRMQGAQFAGVYGMGNTLGHIPRMIFSSTNKAYVPYVFKRYKANERGDESAMVELVRATSLMVSALLFVIVVLIMFSNNIIHLFNDRYSENAIILPLILLAVGIDCNRIIFMNPLVYNVKFLKIKSLIWIIAGALDIGLNFYLIPKYSMYGACASLIISYSISLILIIFFSNKAMVIKYDVKKLFYTVLVSVVFAMCYFIGKTPTTLLIKLPLACLYMYILIRINNIQRIIINKIKNYVKVLHHK